MSTRELITIDQLRAHLAQLDPGQTLRLHEGVLRAMLRSEPDALRAAEALAAQNRCAFTPPDTEDGCACFEKNDVF